MSMYGLVFPDPGRPDRAALLVGMLDPIRPGRFRDCWLEKHGDLTVIALYTRNGGGNREHYSDDTEAGPGCDCTGCTATYGLPSHPLYLGDEDMEFDSTYATFYFRLPDDLAPEVRGVLEDAAEPAKVNMAEKWQAAIDAITTHSHEGPTS